MMQGVLKSRHIHNRLAENQKVVRKAPKKTRHFKQPRTRRDPDRHCAQDPGQALRAGPRTGTARRVVRKAPKKTRCFKQPRTRRDVRQALREVTNGKMAIRRKPYQMSKGCLKRHVFFVDVSNRPGRPGLFEMHRNLP